MAVYRGPIRRLFHRSSAHSVFARLLAKPGFNPDDVRAEVTGRVEHGVPGAAPECSGAGALALLVGRELGWVAPTGPPGGNSVIAVPERLDSWIEAAWVTA
jgi:hypothetical protein